MKSPRGCGPTSSIKKLPKCASSLSMTKSSLYKLWELILKLLIFLYFVELSFNRFKEKDIPIENINLNDNSKGRKKWCFCKINNKKDLD
jgi:hypothetical protein